MKTIRANTARRKVLTPVFPNVGVQVWYETQLDKLIDASARELLKAVRLAWAKTPPLWDNSHITAQYGDAMPDLDAGGVVFRCQGKLLLMHRTDGEGWAFPGGCVEPNETFEQAARREAFEETLYAYNGPLEPYRLQEWRHVNFATYSADVLEEFAPHLNIEHDGYKWVTIPQALTMGLHPGVRLTLEAKRNEEVAEIASDAQSPTKALQVALQRWASNTIKRFDVMSNKIANDFAKSNANATQRSVMAQFKKAGFTVKFKPTRESMEAYRIVAAENVALIKSIPRKYHEAVEQKVWNAVRNGSDLNKLSTELRKAHGSTVKRAALIARDQNAKAKAVIERVRQRELGIRKGIWMHSNAGKEPRPTHVAMDGKQYDLMQGMWDSDEQEWVHPGQLINCRCTVKPIIDGFED